MTKFRGAAQKASWIAVVALLVGLAGQVSAQSLRQIYYIPVADEDLRTFSASINTNNNGAGSFNVVRSVISITAVTDGTTLYYDHWEDTFDPSIGNPSQASTEIIGDGDQSNGAPPGCVLDVCDVIDAGDVVVFQNDVPVNPRVPANIFYDGGDKIASTELVSITRAGWRTREGTLLAGALELFPTFTWAQQFELPVGININTGCNPNASDTTSIAAGNICMFEYVAASFTAGELGAVIRSDTDGDGTDDRTDVLNPGQVLFLQNLSLGATFTSSDPIQGHILTGDVGSNYEARWFSLVPVEQWDSSYYTPVGTTVAGDEVFVILYNPLTSPITVTADTQTGTSNVVVPAGGIFQYQMPANTGAHFYTATGETFYAISVTDYDATGHDWGFTLLPETSLTSGVIVGWAPGRDAGSPTNPNENGSPVWVTAVGPTTIQVDFDGDGTIDFSQAINALQSLLIYDDPPQNNPGDGDQSGMQISTSDGTLMTAAWGQDPATASGAAPALDLGTTIKPIPFLDIDKSAELAIDTNLNGSIDPGETVRYTITVTSVGRTTAPSVVLEDPTLDGNTAYIANSTEIDGVSLPDDTLPSTIFPLDEGGVNLGDIDPGVSILITFLVVVDDPLTPGVTQIFNSAVLRTVGGGGRSSTTTPVGDPGFTVVKTSDATADVVPGDVINYAVTVTNTGVTDQIALKVLDSLPAGTSYVIETTSATGPSIATQTLSYENTTSGAVGSGNSCNVGSPNWLSRTFSVPDSFTVNSVTLGFVADHFWRGDIEAYLDSPAGTTVQVILANGGDDDNHYDIHIVDGGNLLDDNNADNTGAPYYERDVVPTGPLSGFIGENSAGTWTLRMCDDFPGADDGTFRRAQLNLGGSTSTSQTKTNQAAASNPLLDGDPNNLVLAPDGFSLRPTDTLTITYRVLVADPLVPYEPAIVNVAQVTTLDHPFPVLGTVIDPVTEGGTIGDRVWLDIDGDGVQDVGEPGLPNVTVNLHDRAAGTIYLTTSTDGNGNYIFQHLPPRDYYVDIVDATIPGGLTTSPGTTDPSSPDTTIIAVEQFLDVDFGYTNANPATALIGDFIWSDADADGIQDPGEVGIPGVTLSLVDVSSGSTVATTTTAPDGRYLFAGVNPDEYRIVITDTGSVLTNYVPTTGPQSEGGYQSVPVTVAASDVVLDVDFGFDNPTGTYSITDTTWLDENADMVFDVGEPALANVTVRLLDGSGNAITTTQSAADGSFSFTGVAPGTYTIDIVDANGILTSLGGTTAPAQAGILAVTVTNADITNVSFGYRSPGTIGDRVWSDGDGDGVQDAGELGIGGVTIELLNGLGALVGTTTTAADGSYLFEGLIQGFYTTRIAASNFTAGNALNGYTQTGDPDATLDNQSTVGLEHSQANLTQDFGYQNTALPNVSGTVFEDTDRDGIEDVGETGIAGVTIALQNASGTVIATAVTDANGDYSFPDVPAANYTVRVTDNAGVLSGYQNTSGLDQRDITVAGVDITDVDFGYIRDAAIGSIGDTVYHDLDSDGVQDASEPGISGVTVQLWEDTDGSGTLTGGDTMTATAVTDANGRYDFASLIAGDYFVQVDAGTLPAGVVSTTGGHATSLITLSDGEDYDDADFGYASPPGTVSIGDTVFADVDGDGIQDLGEVGIGGVGLTVSGPSGTFPVTTNPDGSYLVAGLTPGTYTVTVNTGTIPSTYSTTSTNGPNSRNYTLVAGDNLLHADFGYPPAGNSGSIGDTIYLDSNGNASQGGSEPGLAGVTLNLLDGSGNVIASMVTDASGNYDFVGLQPDTYQVVVTDLNGILTGLNRTQTAPSSIVITVAGEDVDSADFGYAPSNGSGTIGGTVWHDVIQAPEGTFDTGEFGIQGVSIELWADVNSDGVITPGTDNLVRNVFTDANGEYVFTGLTFDDFLVRVTDSLGVLSGMNLTVGPTAGADSNSQANPYAVTLSSGAPSNFTADFGYEAIVANSISGTTFFDAQGDGILNGVDVGVGGAALILYRDLDGDGVLDPGEGVFSRTTSNSSGFYQFLGLPDGNWIVAANTTGTFLEGTTQTTQTTTAAVEPVSAAGGQNITDRNFGFHLGGPTLALISHFGASLESDRVIVEWETASEAGTLGFYVFRWGGRDRGWIQINPTMLPGLIDSPLGGKYRVVDETAPGSGYLVYQLLEVEVGGVERHYGPYRVAPGIGTGAAQRMTKDYSARRRLAPSVVKERIRGSRAARKAERQARRDARKAARLRRATGTGQIQIFLEDDGLYFVSTESIAEHLDMKLPRVRSRIEKGRFQLSVSGEQVSWTPASGGAGIYFYGFAPTSSFTRENVYWLARGRGQVMQSVSGAGPAPVLGGSFASTVTAEEDVFAATIIPQEPTEDFWFWKSVIAGLPEWGRRPFDVFAPGLATGVSGQARIAVTVQSASDTEVAEDHHVVVYVNGNQVGEHRFDGLQRLSLAYDFDASILVDGDNVVEVEAVLDTGAAYGYLYVDGFELTYPRRYQAHANQLTLSLPENAPSNVVSIDGFASSAVTILDIRQPNRPAFVTDVSFDVATGHRASFQAKIGSRYVAIEQSAVVVPNEIVRDEPSKLRHPSGAADYLLISPLELTAGAEALADYRSTQGLKAQVVQLQDVYDEFSFGAQTPLAIRDFLSYVHGEWAEVPRYVVLLGKGTYDYKGGAENLLPVILASSPHGMYAADNVLGDVVGDDHVPEFSMGRIPVLTNDELMSYLNKLRDFESDVASRERVVLAADDPDDAGDFTADSLLLSSMLPEETPVENIFLSNLSLNEARVKLFAELSQPLRLVNYMGHGGLDRMANEGLLLSSDASALGATPPNVFASLTCTIGRFEIPGLVSLAESLLAEPGAAIAVWSPTGLSHHNQAFVLNEAFVNAYFDSDTERLGDAVSHALRALEAQNPMPFMLDIYTLLGDPAVRIR